MKKSLILVFLLSATINNSAINKQILKKNLYQAGTLLGLVTFITGTQLIGPYVICTFYDRNIDDMPQLKIRNKNFKLNTLKNFGLALMLVSFLGSKYCYDRI